MKIHWLVFVCIIVLTGCGKSIPQDIIQPDKMERVLYDYHLSMGMSNNLTYTENYQSESYKNYIFQKHRISEAQFDSSMVWYTREAKELTAIYDNLNRRFKREHSQTQLMLESRQGNNQRLSMPGDTVDVWSKGKIHWLNESPINNQLLFDIEADTNYHYKDALLWSVDYHFFSQGEAIMGFNIVYDNDSVVGTTKQVTESGRQTIYLYSDSLYQIKSLNGFVFVPNDTIKNPHILLHNISLTRYHRLDDSLSVAPIKNNPKKSITPKTNKNKKKESKPLDVREEAPVIMEQTIDEQSISNKRKPRKAIPQTLKE